MFEIVRYYLYSKQFEIYLEDVGANGYKIWNTSTVSNNQARANSSLRARMLVGNISIQTVECRAVLPVQYCVQTIEEFCWMSLNLVQENIENLEPFDSSLKRVHEMPVCVQTSNFRASCPH